MELGQNSLITLLF